MLRYWRAIGLIALVVQVIAAMCAPASAAPGDSIIIIANKSYRSAVGSVEFADRDADAMAMAAREALSIPAASIRRFDDMTIGLAADWFKSDGTPGDDLLRHVRTSAQGRRDATVYFYYSGHGVAARNSVRDQDELHLLLNDTRTDAIGRHGLSLEAVKRALVTAQKELMPAGRVVMLVDACFSGFNRDGKEMWKGARAGAVAPRLAVPESVVLLSAAGPAEMAWSDFKRRHGAFTDAIVDGLYGGAADEKGRITAERLIRYANERVSVRLARHPDGARTQTPMLAGDGGTVVASLKTPLPERVPGQRLRFERRCAVAGASSDIAIWKRFLQEECHEDCPCHAEISGRLVAHDRAERLCKEERGELAALKARGASALAEIMALGASWDVRR